MAETADEHRLVLGEGLLVLFQRQLSFRPKLEGPLWVPDHLLSWPFGVRDRWVTVNSEPMRHLRHLSISTARKPNSE